MTAITIEGYSTNPEIEAIAARVFDTVRLSIQRAAEALKKVSTTTLPQRGIEKAAFDFLQRDPTMNQTAISRLAGVSRSGGGSSGTWPLRSGTTIDFAAPDTVLEQAKGANVFNASSGLKFSPSTLAGVRWDGANFVPPGNTNAYANRIIEAVAFKRIYGDITTATAQPSAPAAKELHLKLARLKAVRRFGWEITDYGDDSISCGGDGVDSVQQHKKRGSFHIHTFKRDGESFNISPDRTFIKFDLNRVGPWPRAFIANVFLAEKDASDGFIEFLQRLWDAIGDEVVTIATTLATAALGAGVGAVAGTELMPLVGTIVGAVIGAVIGLVVGWILDSLKDDIFESPENPLGVVLPSQNDLFPGNRKRSPTYMQEFTSGRARYLMSYYWKLVF